MNWFLIVGFVAVVFLVGCAFGTVLGWLDRRASTRAIPAGASQKEAKAA